MDLESEVLATTAEGRATKTPAASVPRFVRSSSVGQSGLIISLDLELAWGVLDRSTFEQYQKNIDGVPDVVRRLLSTFASRSIRATWAAVGLLGCADADDARSMAPGVVPSYRNQRLSPYRVLNGLTAGTAPHRYFAPDLLSEIVSSPGQELATHTFSHYYCMEPGQNAEQFRADLRAASSVNARFGKRPTSIVFPRNQSNPAYLKICHEEGLRSYREQPTPWMYRPGGEKRLAGRAARLLDAYLPLARVASQGVARHPSGMLAIPASRFLRPAVPGRVAEQVRLRRILAEMRATVQNGGFYHLWWHPHNFGINAQHNLEFLSRVLDHFEALRHRFGMQSVTMAEAAEHAW